ncbi:hypothetical protein C9J19_07640 [Photobacterium phosphoreum]|uniref:DUF6602 domain-containing protein n=1 Tax=Photobacterium phosphoreum TaxID=659 RepID=UPI000D15EAC9|nr:DUF6602 domain-containing protein [Photobacterium phosphoreum]PSW29176.1 hypothetical protein C9J19_07640 [Photobacterium phosphoreum]
MNKKTFNTQEFLKELGNDLIHDFEKASRATTPGIKGGVREFGVKQKLESVLPKMIGIGSGCIIDTSGSASNQTDIVLYEKNICPIFSINDDPQATYFPCESVIAVGEVKSDLGTKEIRDAVNKIASVKRLKRFTEDPLSFRRLNSTTVDNSGLDWRFDQQNNYYDQIFGFIICKKFTLKPETTMKHFLEACQKNPPYLSPNALISLDDGLILFANGQLSTENMSDSNNIISYKHPQGEFQYLLHKLITVASNWRTTDAVPTENYIIGDAHKKPITVSNILEF